MQAMIKTAIEFAKNQHVQRVALGFVIGGVVGFAIAKTVEPYIFQEPEYEMFPPYDTPDQEREMTMMTFDLPVGTDPIEAEAAIKKMINTPATDPVIPDARKGLNNMMPKAKYAKPVRAAQTHAAVVSPTVQQVSPANKLADQKHDKPGVSTFSSTRGMLTSNTGGGDPHKKSRPVNPEE